MQFPACLSDKFNYNRFDDNTDVIILTGWQFWPLDANESRARENMIFHCKLWIKKLRKNNEENRNLTSFLTHYFRAILGAEDAGSMELAFWHSGSSCYATLEWWGRIGPAYVFKLASLIVPTELIWLHSGDVPISKRLSNSRWQINLYISFHNWSLSLGVWWHLL